MKRIIIAVLILSLIFSSGCWDYTEYEHLALVQALGVDYDKTSSKVTVTVEYIITSGGGAAQGGGGGGGSKTKFESIKGSGSTISEALTVIQDAIRKRLFYSYLGVVILGKSAAENITLDVIGFIDRTPEVRTSTYFGITDGTAEDAIVTSDPKSSVATGKRIHDIMEQSKDSGSAFPVTIEAFEESLAISGKQCSAPRITVISAGSSSGSNSSSGGGGSSSSGSTAGGGASSGGGSSSSSGGASSGGSSSQAEPYRYTEPKDGYQKIDGIAAFNGEKFVGWLERNESEGLGWILNKSIVPYENVPLKGSNNTNYTLIFKISKYKSKINIKLKDNKPEITINTNVESDLRKYSKGINKDVLTPDVLDTMEKEISEKIQSDINSAINKGQKQLKTDVFCFGFDFYRKYPKLWHSSYEKKWNNIFPTIPIKVNVKTKIINTGTNIKKFSVKQ